jgi:hypothetical protein
LGGGDVDELRPVREIPGCPDPRVRGPFEPPVTISSRALVFTPAASRFSPPVTGRRPAATRISPYASSCSRPAAVFIWTERPVVSRRTDMTSAPVKIVMPSSSKASSIAAETSGSAGGGTRLHAGVGGPKSLMDRRVVLPWFTGWR